MKIEIGESLLYSYLRHVKNCQIVQTNWKSSSNWILNDEIRDSINYEFEIISQHHAFEGIFKTSLEQTIKQAEIDVIGINNQNEVFAIDVAFHENGLQYGSKIETRNRVIKKLLRASIALSAYFPKAKHKLIFCSPKVNPATESIIKEYFEVLENEFNTEDKEFSYYSNYAFQQEILTNTIDKTRNDSDTSELFLRSYKLLQLFGAIGNNDKSPTKPGNYTHDYSLPNDLKEELKSVERKLEILKNSGKGTKSNDEDIELGKVKKELSLLNSDDREEIIKVKKKVPKWFKNPNQINSQILIGYLILEQQQNKVTIDSLKRFCSNVLKFEGNFNQMTIIAERNHAKVFVFVGDKICLWEPVEDFIREEYHKLKI